MVIDDSQQIIDQNRDVYNTIAEHFSDTRSYLWRDLEPFAQFVKAGDSVLDIGCGNARLYQLFQDLSISFTGIDISEGLIEIAHQKYPQSRFVVGDMSVLPFKDNEFDVVFSLVAFHHLPTHESHVKSLREMKRVVKPGGKIILLNWNAYSDWVKQKIEKGDYGDIGHQLFRVPWKTQDGENIGDRIYYGFTLKELEKLFKEARLKLEDQYFLRHAEHVDVKQGMNIVSVAVKEK